VLEPIGQVPQPRKRNLLLKSVPWHCANLVVLLHTRVDVHCRCPGQEGGGSRCKTPPGIVLTLLCCCTHGLNYIADAQAKKEEAAAAKRAKQEAKEKGGKKATSFMESVAVLRKSPKGDFVFGLVP